MVTSAVQPHACSSNKVLHALRPFAVAMAAAGEFDPRKD